MRRLTVKLMYKGLSLRKYFPFLRWFPMGLDVLRADLLAGLTVLLVLIPPLASLALFLKFNRALETRKGSADE